jgi:nucleotide-binding universal stress UspA family protein
MLTILVPVDFSECAYAAARYALKMAETAGNATLVFLHISKHKTENLTEDEQEDMFWEVQQQEYDHYKHFEDNLFVKTPPVGVSIYYKYKIGNTVEDILLFAKETHADLIIMGMHGKSGIAQKWFGGVTTHVIDSAEMPVLVVPENTKFAQVNNVVLACDNTASISNYVKEQLKFITDFFHAKLTIVKVLAHDSLVPASIKMFEQEKDLLQELNASFASVVNSNVAAGINKFIEKENAGMVIITSKKHSALHNVFLGSEAHRITLHSHIPLLVLPPVLKNAVHAVA